MQKQVTVLGARGRFGQEAMDAFLKAGWRVRGFARGWPEGAAPQSVETITGGAFDANAVARACEGSQVIVNALNPPYPAWKRDLPRFTKVVIAAAKASGARVIIPGNVYNYGAGMPQTLLESTPHRPTTRKGRLREEMEESYARAADDGVRTLVLRSGDFFGPSSQGNWLETYLTPKLSQAKLTYPGRHDRIRAWAYLPDMTRAMAALADCDEQLADFERINFPGHNLTGTLLIAELEAICGCKLSVSRFPWPLLRLMSPVWPLVRETLEMRYLWDAPHRVASEHFDRLLPSFAHTPLETALARSVAERLPEQARGAVAASSASPF